MYLMKYKMKMKVEHQTIIISIHLHLNKKKLTQEHVWIYSFVSDIRFLFGSRAFDVQCNNYNRLAKPNEMEWNFIIYERTEYPKTYLK